MTQLNTNKPLLTVGELRKILQDVPDDTRIRYMKMNMTTGLDASGPIHRVEVSKRLLFMVTEYIEQTSLDDYGG